MRRRLRTAVVLLASGLVAGCGRSTPSVVVVVFDALRADRLGCYGNGQGLTPFIDSFAQRSTLFRHAYTAAPWTNPSVASLLTSRFSSEHGMTSFRAVLSPAEVRLPEILGEHGYRRGGFVANLGLDAARGFAQGYEEYRVLPLASGGGSPMTWLSARGETVNDAVLQWLDRLPPDPPRPVYLYVHYMETHTPYRPPEETIARLFAGRPLPDLELANARLYTGNLAPLEPEMMAVVRDLYDAEVAAADRRLRELFAALERRRLFHDAIVIVTADHGEEFGEHGFVLHRATLHEDAVRVPLLLAVPGQSTGRVVDDVVSLVDVAPTVLDLVGVPHPPSFEGRSLLPSLPRPASVWSALARPRPAPHDASVYAELIRPPTEHRLSPQERTAIIARQKIIAGIDGRRAFYDLAADPGETHPDALGRADRERLEHALAQHEPPVAQPDATAPLDAGERDRLRALGYDE